ncbi:nusG [Cucurbita argyrosperma subsp. argyrosperma]
MACGLLTWTTLPLRSPSFPSLSFSLSSSLRTQLSISAALETAADDVLQLSARERRRLRNERRETKTTNWREEVEERLCKKPKKEFANWTEKLNLDYLAKLGPQWWVMRVSRVRGQEIVERLARSLARNYPDLDFKIYYPSVHEKRKLKNGSYTVKPKAVFPGSVFIRCIMNKEMHDFIRECDGVGGFVGAKVGNTKRQINKPKPVSQDDMEAIFKEAKEEQERHDQAFLEKEKEQAPNPSVLETNLDTNGTTATKHKGRPKKAVNTLSPGSTVRVASGTFAEFEGSLKKVNRKSKKVTVGFTLFGKETLVELDIGDIIVETK